MRLPAQLRVSPLSKNRRVREIKHWFVYAARNIMRRDERMEKVYLQLYSLGGEINDLPRALAKLAGIGYAGVEFADNYGGLDGAGLKKLLADNGLEGISAHVSVDKLPEQIELLAAAGFKYAVDPFGRFDSRDDALRMAEQLNRTGELCKRYGLVYGYHNHTQEFALAGDEYILDILIANTEPELCMFQLDAGWATVAGVDPVAYINKHAGRFRLIHVKEASKSLGVQSPPDFSKLAFDAEGRPIFTDEMKRAFREVKETNVAMGKGIINWAGVKKAADAQGSEAYIVEREFDYLNDIFACVKADYEYLKTV